MVTLNVELLYNHRTIIDDYKHMFVHYYTNQKVLTPDQSEYILLRLSVRNIEHV